jgi:hypothetical protein
LSIPATEQGYLVKQFTANASPLQQDAARKKQIFTASLSHCTPDLSQQTELFLVYKTTNKKVESTVLFNIRFWFHDIYTYTFTQPIPSQPSYRKKIE